MTSRNVQSAVDGFPELLSELAADLVSEKRFAPQLRHLLQGPEGQWTRLDLLLESEWSKRGLSACKPAYFNWTNFPDSAYGPGFVTITFFQEDIHWHSLTSVNRTLALNE